MGIKHLVGHGWVVHLSSHSLRNIELLSFLHPNSLSPRALREGGSCALFIFFFICSGVKVGLGPQVGQGMVPGGRSQLCVCIPFLLLLNKQLGGCKGRVAAILVCDWYRAASKDPLLKVPW